MSFEIGSVGLWSAALDGCAATEVADIVGALDEQGWAALWFGEAYGREAFTAAQLCLGASRRMVIGTGIANVHGRDAVAAAAAGRTLNALYPNRFVLGLGVSHAPLVERVRGHVYDKPLALMRNYLDALDAAPALVPGEAAAPPRVLAALGPRMIDLARDRAHGAHPYLVTPEHTAQTRDRLGTGSDGGPAPMLVVEQAAVVDPAADGDPEVWRQRAHDHLNIYTGLPNYRTSWLRQGFTEDDLVRGGSARLADAMVTRGLDATRARIRAHLDAGATTVLVQVLGPAVHIPPRADWARLAAALR